MSNPAPRPGSNSDSEEEWGTLMRQLRLQPKARPRPFFYARVQARLATQLATAGSWLPAWARRPAYLALLGALMLAVSGDGAGIRAVTASTPYHTYRPPQPPQFLPR